jgi:hypothetical protein
MKRSKKLVRRRNKKVFAAAVGLGCLGIPAVNAATTLSGLNDTNALVPSDHGSNLAGTPDVALNWSGAQWDQYDGWPNDPGNGVYQIDGASDGSATHTIELTPGSGWNVKLTSLDLNVWAGGGDTDVNWSLDGTNSGSLGSGVFSTNNDSAITHDIGLSGTGGEKLTLSLTQVSGVGSYLAMDNLTFDQIAVPEPSSLVVAMTGMGGLGALAIRRKRKK